MHICKFTKKPIFAGNNSFTSSVWIYGELSKKAETKLSHLKHYFSKKLDPRVKMSRKFNENKIK